MSEQEAADKVRRTWRDAEQKMMEARYAFAEAMTIAHRLDAATALRVVTAALVKAGAR